MSERTPRARDNRCCAVPTCSNKRIGKKNEAGLSFHRIPKDPKIRRMWLDQCLIPDNFNADYATICSEHFETEDYERIYQKQLMGIERRSILKKDVIPHKNIPISNVTKSLREGLRSRIKTNYQDLVNSKNTAMTTSKKESSKVKMKTINGVSNDETSNVESIIVDYESDLESFCLRSVEEILDPLENINSIENVETEPDYKFLYYQTLEKYETLKSKVMQMEKDLESEKKRVNDYQTMLTQIFTRGEIHFVHEEKTKDSANS